MNWIDTPLLVYGSISGHPAETLAEQELRQGEWASSTYVLTEVYQVLLRSYGVAPERAAEAVALLSHSAIQWVALDLDQTLEAVGSRAIRSHETADALLLPARIDNGTLITTDTRWLRVAAAQGVDVRNPIRPPLRAEIARWEAVNLPPKGLDRTLHGIERWLRGRSSALADEFLEATNNLHTLPL